MESEMTDFISSLEDSGIPETMLEATRNAFGTMFGLPEPPVHIANRGRLRQRRAISTTC